MKKRIKPQITRLTMIRARNYNRQSKQQILWKTIGKRIKSGYYEQVQA